MKPFLPILALILPTGLVVPPLSAQAPQAVVTIEQAAADDLEVRTDPQSTSAEAAILQELDLGRRAAAMRDPAGALTHYLVALAARPTDTEALIGAGEASLAIEDPDAALNFFARAEESDPRNGRIKAGLGSALVRLRETRAALRMFEEALRLGVPVVDIAADRGLAWDLRGDMRRARSDYELVLAVRQDAEALRRLALSTAIAGDPLDALATLDPLLRSGDKAAWRARAFILAISGDLVGAEETARAALSPVQADALKPFLGRIAKLKPAQQVAAVTFGHFPSEGRSYSETDLLAATGTRLPDEPMPAASPQKRATLAPKPDNTAARPSPSGAETSAPASTMSAAPPIEPALSAPTGQVASTSDATIARVRAEAEARLEARRVVEKKKLDAAKAAAAKRNPPRVWVQVATGAYKPDLDREWLRLTGKYGRLLAGQSPWTTPFGRTNRLLVGPFKSSADAQAFVNRSAEAGLGTSRFTSEAGQDVERVR